MLRARQWLAKASPKTQNQRADQLLGLGWCGATAGQTREPARRLAAEQRADGGWAQLPGLESDAWATGLALFALRESGHLQATDPEYRRGTGFLVRTQFVDGSWRVQSRSWAFQPHFDSQFLHGKDQ